MNNLLHISGTLALSEQLNICYIFKSYLYYNEHQCYLISRIVSEFH